MYRLNEHDFENKIKSKAVISYLAERGHSEILYISTIYILPKYKRKGHGKNILNIIKKNNTPLVLCSSAYK